MKKNSKRTITSKGQGLLEMLVLTMVFIVLLQIGFFLVWTFISRIWMEHHLYQGILCVAQQKEIPLCKSMVLKKIQILNPAGSIKKLEIKKFAKKWKGYIHWQFYKKNIFIEESFKPP